MPIAVQRLREALRIGNVEAPVSRVRRDRIQGPKARQHSRRRLGAPTRQTRIAVSAVANQRKIVGDRPRLDSELLYDPIVIALNTSSPVKLYDSTALNTLRKILVRCADNYPLYT